MIMQPAFIAAKTVKAAKADLERKKNVLPAIGLVRLEDLTEGASAQILHTGSYSAEGPAIATPHAFIHEHGKAPRGKHHEICKSDASCGAKVTLLTPAVKGDAEHNALKKALERMTAALADGASGISVTHGDQPEKGLDEAAMAVAAEERTDLIAVLVGAKHHKREAVRTKNFHQALITNEHGVPVLRL